MATSKIAASFETRNSYGLSYGNTITITTSAIGMFWFPIIVVRHDHIDMVTTAGPNAPAIVSIYGSSNYGLEVSGNGNVGVSIKITSTGSRGRIVIMAPDAVLRTLSVSGAE